MKIVTFGEVMGRLNPPGFTRLQQCLPGALQFTFAGAEANVAASLAMLGAEVSFVTALPDNPLAENCIRTLRGLGVDTSRIVRRSEGRLGLYFVETGANQRPSNVVYDREGSTISRTDPQHYAWEETLADADWLHITGITPSISKSAADSTLAAAQAAKSRGSRVSCDLNFRKKLWRWEPGTPPRELAERVMRELLPSVDVVIANEADCEDVLGISAGESNVDAGELVIDRYPHVAQLLIDQHPNVEQVAITLRESHSATHNDWGAMLYANGEAHFAPVIDGSYQPYPIRAIVDRVGAGDSFGAGLIYSQTTPELKQPQDAIRFATAASCLAHSITGDFNYSSRSEIESLMGGATSGRVVR